MRKIFANLKSVVALAVVAAMTLSVSCMYDDTALTKRVTKVEKDLAALTEKVNKLDNGAVEDVVDGKVVITGVAKDDAGNVVLTLSNGETVTVLAEAKALQYRVTDGVLEISADGETWVAVQASADCFIKEVVENQDGTVSLVLANGKVFTSAVAELIECAATRSQVYVLPETTKAVRFTINDAVVDINVMNQPLGWSATVEEYVAPALPEEGEDEEPDYGGDVMPLAAGGKEYVLNITGPAKDFAQAAKEGVVSVHFNTAAGACKVLKVEVTVAELTLEVKDGYVTLTNTVAYEQTNDENELVTEFAKFIIGVIDAKDYAQYGDQVFTATFDNYEWEYTANVNKTYRTGGFRNRVELTPYEEGVCEKESYTFPVEELSKMFYPIYNFEAGNEYIIFVTLEEELYNYEYHPVLSTAVKATYAPQSLTATYVSSTPDGAVYNFNLAGYTHYVIGWASVEVIDLYIAEGMVTSLEDYLAKWSQMGGLTQLPGAIVEGPFVGQYNLADLAPISLLDWAPSMNPETEYYFYIYPFNFESEMDLYSPADPANVYTFGTFETSAYVPAAEPFEHGFTYEYEYDAEEGFLSIKNGTFGENVVAYVHGWYNTAAPDQPTRSAELLAKGLVPTEYGPFEDGTYPSSPVVYLCMVAVNNAYEYVYFEIPIEVPFTYDYEVVFTKAVFDNGTLELTNDTENDFVKLILNPGLTAVAAGDYTGVSPDWFNGGIMPWSSADALEFDAYNSTFNLTAAPASSGQYYVSDAFAMNISVDGDVYTIVATDSPYMDTTRNIKYTFTGAIEAAAAIDLTGYVQAESASVGHNEGTGTVRFDFTFGGEACSLKVYPFFGWENEWHSGEGYNIIEELSIIGSTPTSSKADIYKQADGSYLVLIEATLPVVGVKKMYFNITL